MSDHAQLSPAAAKPAWAVAKARWHQHQSDCDKTPVNPDLRVGIAASFTVNTLDQFVGAHLLSEGFRPEISIGPYNQLFQVCLDPAAYFGPRCDALALLWRIEDLMADELAAFLADDDSGLASAHDKVAALTCAIAGLRATFSGTVIVSAPTLPAGQSTTLLSLDNATRLGAFHRAVSDTFIKAMAEIRGVHLLDCDAIQRHVGYPAAFDSQQWYLHRQPFTDAFLHDTGMQLGRIVVAVRRSPKKCVVLDCDHTLWGGVIGEDGLDGIELGDEFPGSAFRDFQRLLLHWRRQGVFLAIASNSNEADVWEVFDRHDAMVLRRTDISAWQINLQAKAENIPLIAKSLNIGIDSLIFIAGNSMEISYMRQAQPNVTSVLLPKDPADMLSMLQEMTLFDRFEVTQEDMARVDMMRAELDSDALGARMSKDEFLRALELKLDLFLARSEDLRRVTQLVNKTNQFNLTTLRRTLDEVRILAGAPIWRIYGLRAYDKFNDTRPKSFTRHQMVPIWCWFLIATVATLLVAAYQAGIDAGVDKFIRAASGGAFLNATCVAATRWLTGLGDFACVGSVSLLMNRLGLTADLQSLSTLGLHWPDYLSNVTFLDQALLDLFNHAPWIDPSSTRGPPYIGVTGIGWGMDIGYADFVYLSYRLFGFSVEALYRGYWAFYGASVAFFLLAYRGKVLPLTLIAAVASIHYLLFATHLAWDPAGPIRIETPVEARFLSTLGIIPTLHYLCACLEKRRLRRGEVALLSLQGCMLAFAILFRTTVLWVVIAAIFFGAAYWLFFRDGVSAVLNRRRYQVLGLLLVAALAKVTYVALASHPGIAANGYTSRHNLWPTLLYSMQTHPHWAERHGTEFEGATGDAVATFAWRRYWAQHPEETPLVTDAEGNITQVGIERLSRGAFINFFRDDPRFVMEVFGYYNPRTVVLVCLNVLRTGYARVPAVAWLLLFGIGLIGRRAATRADVRQFLYFVPILGTMTVISCLPNLATFTGSDTLVDTEMLLAILSGVLVVAAGGVGGFLIERVLERWRRLESSA